ncbi:MAG: ATP-binding protein [Acidimicrobiales bacterium]
MTVTFTGVLQQLAPLGGPLAGREKQMAALRRAWDDAVHGSGRTVLLAGEAGVGKTRLAAELAGEVDATGAVVLVGTCPAGGAEPYHPLVEALGALPTAEVDRPALLDALAGAVVARARRAPVLLVLDDLHRADRSTLLAVRKLVEAGAASPLLVVATYRDTVVDRSHPLAEFLSSVLAQPGVERVGVESLPQDAVTTLVGDTELGRRLWRQTGGNPVWVAELLRPGALDRPESAPSDFDELVGRRMAALSSPERSVLQAAAVIGSEFSVDAAAEAAGVSVDRAVPLLKKLAAAGFFVEEPGGAGETRRFVHDMVREAVGRGLTATERVRLHLRIGQALDRPGRGPAAPAALTAWHFRSAAPVGGSAPALHHSVQAADRAMELLAWEEAAVQYGHALAAATGSAREVRADLLLALGEAQRLAGEAARARQAFLEAAMLARYCADGPRMARAALALGQVGAVWGTDAELEAVAAEARALLGGDGSSMPGSPARRPVVDFASGSLYDVLDGITPTVDPHHQEPPVQVRDRGDGVALLRARHLALAGPEHVDARLAAATEMVSAAEESGDDELTATARGWRLVDALQLGRLDDVHADQRAHAGAALRLGGVGPASDAAAWSAMRALLDGRADDARSAAADAFDLAVEAGDPEADASFLVQRWWLALEWGSPEALSQVVGACRERASTGVDGRTWRAALALALSRMGRLDLAAEELRRATDHGLGELARAPGRLHPLACLAEVAWMVGDGHRAAMVGPLLEPFAGHLVVAGRGRLCQGSVARSCGMVAASAERWDEAQRHFKAALAVHRDIAALPLLARTQFEWSTVLVQRDRKVDRRRAAEWRRKSAELADGLGMSRLVQEVAAAAT